MAKTRADIDGVYAGSARMEPLAPPARDRRIDALRGLAIFGVLLLNLPVYARTPVGTGWVESILPGPMNVGPALFAWLGQGKFLGILAILYGVGAEARRRRLGAGFARIEARRLLFLAALGVLHGLLWPGDILVAWALTGAALLVPGRFWGLGLFLPAALMALGYPSLVEPARRAAVAGHANSGLTPLLVMWAYLPLQVPVMIAQAAVGPRLVGRSPLLALAVGLPLAAIPATPLILPVHPPAWLSALGADLGATAMALGFAGLVVRHGLGRIEDLVAAVGAAPLSNYLLHTLIFVAFPPPRLHATGVLLLAVVTYVLLALLSRAWLRRHPRGPIEALWRRWSYG